MNCFKIVIFAVIWSLGSISLFAQAIPLGTPPDILIKSKLDHDFTELFIAKARSFLVSNGIKDPIDFKLGNRISIAEYPSDYVDMLNGEVEDNSVLKLMESLAGFLQVKQLGNARFLLDIQGLGQKVEKLSVNITPDYDPVLDDIVTNIEIKLEEVKIFADSVEAQIQVPKDNQFKNFLTINMDSPSLETPEGAEIAITLNFIVHQEEVIKFEVKDASFTKVGSFIEQWGERIQIEPNLSISPHPYPLIYLGYGEPQARVVVNNDYVEFSDEFWADFMSQEFGVPAAQADNVNLKTYSLSYFVGRYGPRFQELLLDLVVTQIKTGSLDSILKKINEISVPKTSWFSGVDLNSRMTFLELRSDPVKAKGVIDLYMQSDFCESHVLKDIIIAQGLSYNDETRKKPELLEQCLTESTQYPHPLKMTKDDFSISDKFMNGAFSDEDTDVVISASQEYISKILELTARRGMWDEFLHKQDLAFNEKANNMAFVNFTEKGNRFDLYLNLMRTNLNTIGQFAAKGKTLQFPVKLGVEIKIVPSGGSQKKKGDPMLVLNIIDADTSDEFLLKGDPSLRLTSQVHKVRELLKTKVLNILKNEIAKLVGFSIKTEIPSLTNLNLNEFNNSHFDFFSDGHGRAIITVDL
jgi:hypothetical protein